MNKEFFENKEGCSAQTVSKEEVLKEIKSKGLEGTNAEVKEMLDEIGGVMTFLRDRFTEIIDKHKAVSCVGALGLVAGVSFAGRPITFAGVGTSKALSNAFKVIMTGMMSREN